jgi:hypothetical protein
VRGGCRCEGDVGARGMYVDIEIDKDAEVGMQRIAPLRRSRYAAHRPSSQKYVCSASPLFVAVLLSI